MKHFEQPESRRKFLKNVGVAALATSLPVIKIRSENPVSIEVEVVNPLNRVPLSFIIDDSTCLVNMAHFGIPQFAEVFPDKYKQDWRKLPREIPDSFVREFGEWCHEKGVKGKYSIVPYPACTGWVSRFIPGWSKNELEESLKLVRELMVPDWDIHPEMISHTRVIDIKTGVPYPHATPEYMENWEWSQTRSSDELGEYLAYALNILKEAGLDCEGITTPGGFGSRNVDNLAIATLNAVRDVYGNNLTHFFRDLYTEPEESVEPIVYYKENIKSENPACAISIIGCTGDWFGGWDGLRPGESDKFITEDLSQGRMVDVIEKREPAIMVCHWPGIYYNNEKIGFNVFKTVVNRLHQKYDNLIWMKNSEIARYWAAKELTEIRVDGNKILLNAPFGSERFTLKVNKRVKKPKILFKGKETELQGVDNALKLKSGTWTKSGKATLLSFDLMKGSSQISL